MSILLEKSIRLAKNDPGDKKWSILGAMGFIAETGTTVGYGTLTPKTDQGKMLTILIVIVMVPFMGFILGIFGTGTHKHDDNKNKNVSFSNLWNSNSSLVLMDQED